MWDPYEIPGYDDWKTQSPPEYDDEDAPYDDDPEGGCIVCGYGNAPGGMCQRCQEAEE